MLFLLKDPSQILLTFLYNPTQETEDEDTIVYTAGSNGKPLLASIKKEFDLNQIIMKLYQQDKIYSKILENPKAYAKFGVKEGLIFTKNNLSQDVICVSPKAIHKSCT